jgi:uncharacterized circularly permuted ATP-grasp superfamily protein/uncharacterized alpha-E superfamily protein
MAAARELLDRITGDAPALARRQLEVDGLVAASGAAHLVVESTGEAKNRPWRLDPVPYVLSGETFDALATGVTERLRGLEELLADLYGPRRVVREGIVPTEALASSVRYRLAAVGAPAPRRWLTTYAVDVLALADGSWRIVQDLTDTPTGVGYALLDRSVMARVAMTVLGEEEVADIASISGFPAELRHALAGLTDAASPRMVLYSGGVGDPAYVEHSSLARQLGFNLVERPDLVVRRGRLWLRTLGGLDPVDVVYRRVADDALDPIEIQAAGGGGVPGLTVAAAEGGVALANAHGAGVIEDRDLRARWPAAMDALAGAAPRLRPLGPRDQPLEVPALRHGRVGAAQVVVRLHAVAGPDGITVMAGGNGRVLAPGDDPAAPSAQVAKDVWVLGADRAAPVIVAPHLPQVDLARSVPTRAADALFWMRRAAERAEAIARTARTITARRQQDPALVHHADGRWARRMGAALRTVAAFGSPEGAGAGPPPAVSRPATMLHRELAAAAVALGEQLDALVAEAATVGEYLSGTTNRVLTRIAPLRRTFASGRAPIDELDDTVVELAALAGLWTESVVRGPAWRFGELGRRLERADVVVGLVEALAGPSLPGPDGPEGEEPAGSLDLVARSAWEVLLASNESLVAYRRHHRSDVEVEPARELLLDDADNPRSYAACVARLAEHATALGWADGERAVAALAQAAPSRPALAEFAALIARTWFATPVDPVMVHGEVNA